MEDTPEPSVVFKPAPAVQGSQPAADNSTVEIDLDKLSDLKTGADKSNRVHQTSKLSLKCPDIFFGLKKFTNPAVVSRFWQQGFRARRCERRRREQLEPVQSNGKTRKHDEHSVDYVENEQDFGQLHLGARSMSKYAPSKVLLVQWSKPLSWDIVVAEWEITKQTVSFRAGQWIRHGVRGHQEAFVATKRWQLDRSVAADRVRNHSYSSLDLAHGVLSLWSPLSSRISYWDLHREKVVVLTDNSIINVTYDFIGKKITDYSRIMLADLRKIRFGNLTYPKGSMMG